MRIDALAREQMDAQQRTVYDEASGGRRGKAPVPLTAWLHSPAIAAHAQRLGEALRFETALPPRVVALAALVVAAHWRAPYVWSAQEAKLRAAGMPDAAIRAIARHEAPVLEPIEDRAAYAAVRMLLDQHALDDATYAMAVEVFTERGVVELITTAGYYTMVAMTLNAFEIDEGASMPD